MTTQHLAIVQAIAQRLEQDPALADVKFYVNRRRAIPPSVARAVVVRLGRSLSQEVKQLGGRTSWQTLLEIECYGRDGADDVPGAVADRVLEAVFDILDAGPGLGYGVMDIEPVAGDTLAWDFDELDNSMACVTARFVVKHQTNGRTLKL
ncbi:hypothetical protein [Massilia varians]|uniref:hypothetical protein n=1 Tax=Massilia varians TaxID=457921 RepID=UPI00255233FF|nr:hypothetical protein [Massilia varians]MDK6079662.1 hypothetical protein [Massilia varians]